MWTTRRKSRTIRFCLDLNLPPRAWILAVTAAIVIISATQLGSENVNLTTYYPAPSGVYTQMITTGKTYLATQPGGGVRIGQLTPGNPSPAMPAFGLEVTGDAYLATSGGKVGIGTASPQAALDVQSTTSGLAPPRMTNKQMLAASTPAGSIVYNSTVNLLYFFDGSQWKPVSAYPQMVHSWGTNTAAVNCPAGTKIVWALGWTNDGQIGCDIDGGYGRIVLCRPVQTINSCIGGTMCRFSWESGGFGSGFSVGAFGGKMTSCDAPGRTCIIAVCQ